jgi:hypothetical protein
VNVHVAASGFNIVASMMPHTSRFKNAAALLVVATLALLARPGGAQLVT